MIEWWVSAWEWVSESFFFKKQTIFVYQKNHPNIVLLILDAKAKPLATLNK